MSKGKRKPATAKPVMPKPEARELTDMQESFVREYLVDMNATQAAIRAKYSEDTAGQLGWQNLQIPSIRSAIDHELTKRFERLDLRADRVLLELRRLAFGRLKDIAKYGANAPELISTEDLDDDAAALMKSITFSESSSSSDKGDSSSKSVSFAMHDKKGALEVLAKHFKLLTDKVEHTGKDGGPIETKDLTAATSEELLAELQALREKQKLKR